MRSAEPARARRARRARRRPRPRPVRSPRRPRSPLRRAPRRAAGARAAHRELILVRRGHASVPRRAPAARRAGRDGVGVARQLLVARRAPASSRQAGAPRAALDLSSPQKASRTSSWNAGRARRRCSNCPDIAMSRSVAAATSSRATARPRVRPRAPVTEHTARDHETGLALRAAAPRARRLVLVEEAVGHVELGLDVRLRSPRSPPPTRRARAEKKTDRLREDRLPGARLTRDRVQARREREVRLADEDEVLDPEPSQHDVSERRARRGSPRSGGTARGAPASVHTRRSTPCICSIRRRTGAIGAFASFSPCHQVTPSGRQRRRSPSRASAPSPRPPSPRHPAERLGHALDEHALPVGVLHHGLVARRRSVHQGLNPTSGSFEHLLAHRREEVVQRLPASRAAYQASRLISISPAMSSSSSGVPRQSRSRRDPPG